MILSYAGRPLDTDMSNQARNATQLTWNIHDGPEVGGKVLVRSDFQSGNVVQELVFEAVVPQ